MKQVFEAVINRGGYKLASLLDRIDQYAAEGRLSVDERDSLTVKAREKARAADEIDITAMLLDHEMRLQALEQRSGSGAGSDTPLEEYTVGTPTVAGARWLWQGIEYEVVHATPENPCVWSPEGYPYYWKRVG
jgi:hypothetical protein